MRLLGNDLNHIELKLDGGLAAKHGNDDVDHVVVDIDAFDGAGEGTQRTIQNPDGIAHSIVDDDFLLFHTHGVDFVFSQGSGIVAGRTDETGEVFFLTQRKSVHLYRLIQLMHPMYTVPYLLPYT